MSVTKWMRCFVGLVASAGLPVFAADNCSGTFNTVNTSSSTFEAAKGHSMTSFVYNQISRSENAPLFNVAGECTGYMLPTPDGKAQMAGACIQKAADGSSYSVVWELAPGAERGTWKLIGGTGKFAGKKASGWWQTQFSEGKLGFGVWGGTCE